MLRIYKNLIILIFLIIPIVSNAHVQHYDNLNRIEFDIYRNNWKLNNFSEKISETYERCKQKTTVKES